jgi:YbbR domain-containing protein
VDFELDEKVHKRVKLTPLTQGDPADGYRLVDVDVKPAKVELLGPASTLVGMSEVPTAVVDVTGLQASVERETSVGRLPGGVVRMDDAPVVVQVEVEPVAATTTFEGIPVVIRNRAWVAEVEVVSVAVSGPVALVSDLSAADITVVVDVPADAPAKPTEAQIGRGAVNYQVLMPNADRLSVAKVTPSHIVVRPVE